MKLAALVLSFTAGVAASFLLPKAWAKLRAWLVAELY